MSEKVLFQYKTTPSFGFFGKYGGKSISVYSDGNVVDKFISDKRCIVVPNYEVIRRFFRQEII